jgi:hypothetical protein
MEPRHQSAREESPLLNSMRPWLHHQFTWPPDPTRPGVRRCQTPQFWELPRRHADKGQVSHHRGQPLANHLEPNWVHPQPGLELPFTLCTTAEPLPPPERR